MGKREPVKQLSLLDCLPVSQRQKAQGHKYKGQYKALKAKRKVVSLNHKIILQKIKDLRSNKEIATSLGITSGVVAQFRREMFGKNDPLELHMIAAYQSGESGNAIARRLNVPRGCVSHILRKSGIKPWDNYVAIHEDSGNSKRKRRMALQAAASVERANDLYCIWVDRQSVKETAKESGYGVEQCNMLLLSVPIYKAQSEDRMNHSEYNRVHRNGGLLSKQFRSEKDFQAECVAMLRDDYVVEQNSNGFCHIEVDLLVIKEQCDILIELKITSRKVIEAMALGQALITKTSYTRKRSHALICFPDDCRLSPGFVGVAGALGVSVCCYGELKRVIDGLE